MTPFEYCTPGSISEAVDLLADKGEKARLLAGGTDLLVQLRLGLFKLDLVIDVKRIPELECISFDPTEGLIVGAAVTCANLCEHPSVVEAYPGLVDAASIIGSTAIQARATLGGNLCNAAPSGDTIPAMIVLSAECTIAGPQGNRSVPVEEFCLGPGQTVLRKGAVVPTPLLVSAAGKSLVGKKPTGDALTDAARIAQHAAQPITDVRGTQPQRSHLVGVLVKRALGGAVQRAKTYGPALQDANTKPEEGEPASD